MRQTKKYSFIESCINSFVGYLISSIVCYFVLPEFGFKVSFNNALSITFIFAIISIIRSYIIRRIFNNIKITRVNP